MTFAFFGWPLKAHWTSQSPFFQRFLSLFEKPLGFPYISELALERFCTDASDPSGNNCQLRDQLTIFWADVTAPVNSLTKSFACIFLVRLCANFISFCRWSVISAMSNPRADEDQKVVSTMNKRRPNLCLIKIHSDKYLYIYQWVRYGLIDLLVPRRGVWCPAPAPSALPYRADPRVRAASSPSTGTEVTTLRD